MHHQIKRNYAEIKVKIMSDKDQREAGLKINNIQKQFVKVLLPKGYSCAKCSVKDKGHKRKRKREDAFCLLIFVIASNTCEVFSITHTHTQTLVALLIN